MKCNSSMIDIIHILTYLYIIDNEEQYEDTTGKKDECNM